VIRRSASPNAARAFRAKSELNSATGETARFGRDPAERAPITESLQPIPIPRPDSPVPPVDVDVASVG
jgi:hypothetical protein